MWVNEKTAPLICVNLCNLWQMKNDPAFKEATDFADFHILVSTTPVNEKSCPIKLERTAFLLAKARPG